MLINAKIDSEVQSGTIKTDISDHVVCLTWWKQVRYNQILKKPSKNEMLMKILLNILKSISSSVSWNLIINNQIVVIICF